MPLLFLPQIASTPLGKPLFVKLIEAKTKGHVEITALKLSWLGPQTFRGIKWTHDEITATVNHLEVDAPFWSFSGPFHFNFQAQIFTSPSLAFIFGKSIDIAGSASFDKTDLILSSTTFNTELKGFLSKEAMTLRTPLSVPFHLDFAENPVRLSIDPKGFSFPLPFKLKKLSIGKATIDANKIRLKNDGLFSFLKIGIPQITAWITPVPFTLHEGILTLQRIDALLTNSIHICLWGTIDLLQDRLHLTLGLPADTLQKTFGIQNLPPAYVMKIPVRGSLQTPSIDTSSAIAKITALVAKGQLPKKGIFGNLVDIFSSKEDKDIPPPNRPFPWEVK